MSLPVPLSVRVGDRHITREVKSLSFRREAIGGVRSISFGLARPLSDLEGLDPLAKVYIYDTRTAATVAEGRLADTGRTASPDSGQSWDVVAFGPAQHASDITAPLVYIDRSLEGWHLGRLDNAGRAGASFESAVRPTDPEIQGLMLRWEDGALVQNGTSAASRYARLAETGQKLARFRYDWVAGATVPSWEFDAIFSNDGVYPAVDGGPVDSFTTTVGGRTLNVLTHFTNGRNVVDLRTEWVGALETVNGSTTWVHAVPVVEAIRLDRTGAEVTSGYTGAAAVSTIVEDVLGRWLTQYDGAAAVIEQTGDPEFAHSVEQLSYPNGVTAEQVLDDLMVMEPGFRWYTTPDATGNGYGFRWEQWSSVARYEATLEDGGNFPLSTQDLFNRVRVIWKDASGRNRSTLRTRACAVLDDAGLVRQAQIDLGSELGTVDAAERAGDTFLSEHNVPKNAGTLTVARPIRDVITGAMVDPWEVEPGELVRVLGVEAYPDSLNASTNDGQGVFRIFAVDYNAEGNVATLALDSDPRETADALVKLLKQRSRR